MSKKTPSPTKEVPSSVSTMMEHEPKASVITGESNTRFDNNDTIPKLAPPEALFGTATDFTAAVWEIDKHVNALYNTHHNRNAWMHIIGKGWVRLTTASDSSCEAMNILAAHARVKNAKVNYAVDGGQVTEMYVW